MRPGSSRIARKHLHALLPTCTLAALGSWTVTPQPRPIGLNLSPMGLSGRPDQLRWPLAQASADVFSVPYGRPLEGILEAIHGLVTIGPVP